MSAPKAAPPSTYREWLDLFLAYATIIIEVRPQEAAGLFSYISRIGEFRLQITLSYGWTMTSLLDDSVQ